MNSNVISKEVKYTLRTRQGPGKSLVADLVHHLEKLYGSLSGNKQNLHNLNLNKKASQKCMKARIER